MWTDERIEIGRELFLAIESGETERVRELCTANPWLVRDYMWQPDNTWMHAAARTGHVETTAAMLELGFNIDALRLPEKSSALSIAIDFEHMRLVRLLLSQGANPNNGRSIIGAL